MPAHHWLVPPIYSTVTYTNYSTILQLFFNLFHSLYTGSLMVSVSSLDILWTQKWLRLQGFKAPSVARCWFGGAWKENDAWQDACCIRMLKGWLKGWLAVRKPELRNHVKSSCAHCVFIVSICVCCILLHKGLTLQGLSGSCTPRRSGSARSAAKS